MADEYVSIACRKDDAPPQYSASDSYKGGGLPQKSCQGNSVNDLRTRERE